MIEARHHIEDFVHAYRRLGRSALTSLLILMLAAVVPSTLSESPASASLPLRAPATPQQGGSLTVTLTGTQWLNLDPPKDIEYLADATLLNAIYGQLFELGPDKNIVPSEAAGYKFTHNNLELDIFLRHGLTFQDGSPFNAQAVAASIKRDLLPANGCACDVDFSAVSSISATGPYTVALHLSRVDASLLWAFLEEAPNWTVSPTALAKEGQSAFGQRPVGAGPFEVVSNVANSTLSLRRFTGYWEKSRPYLDQLTFKAVGTDQSAYAALQSGEVQMNEGISSFPMIQQALANSKAHVVIPSPAGFGMVQINQLDAPFNNILAREAIQYATNSKALLSSLYPGIKQFTVIEGPTGPGQRFYYAQLPGFHAYDLQKARQFVHRLGGLSVNLATDSNTGGTVTEAEEIASEWSQAGIHVSLNLLTLQQYLSAVQHHSFQAAVIGYSSIDPALSLKLLFAKGGYLTSVSDPVLERLIGRADATMNAAQRGKIYEEIGSRLNTQALSVPLYASTSVEISSSKVGGIGSQAGQINTVSTNAAVNWEGVYLTNKL